MWETEDRRKYRISARERGPGPGRYYLPTTIGAKNHDFTRNMRPSYSFGKRLEKDSSMGSKDESPGPKYKVNSRYTRVGPEGEPKYSMLSRQNELDSFRPPGPGAYNNHLAQNQTIRRAPTYSIGSRTRNRRCDANPAANAYTLPELIGPVIINKKAEAAYTMAGRATYKSFDEDLAKTPGPAKYEMATTDSYRNKPPHYSMLGRKFAPGDKTRKPGPGAHFPEKVFSHLPRAPIPSIGIRHSEFLSPLIVEPDPSWTSHINYFRN